MARVVSINISTKKGIKKTPVLEAKLVAGSGIEGDAHAGDPIKQVSFLGIDDIKGTNLNAGDYAENITTEGISMDRLTIGTRVKIGSQAVLEISQIGKKCHTRCSIYNEAGDCIMPKKGIFARVIKGGLISTGDDIVLI